MTSNLQTQIGGRVLRTINVKKDRYLHASMMYVSFFTFALLIAGAEIKCEKGMSYFCGPDTWKRSKNLIDRLAPRRWEMVVVKG